MAFTFQEEVSNGIQTVYPVDFEFRNKAHVYVYTGEHTDYATQMSYQWINGDTEIELLNITEVPAGTTFFIRRIVPRDDLVHKFVNKAIRGKFVDEENYHLLYLTQEFIDGFVSLDEIQSVFGNLNMRNNRIINLSRGEQPTDAVNVEQAQELASVEQGRKIVQSSSTDQWPVASAYVVGTTLTFEDTYSEYTVRLASDGLNKIWVEAGNVGDELTLGAASGESLQVFADDAAAGAGGLTQDQLYKTPAGEVRIKL